MVLSQQESDLGIGQHIGQTFGGVVRVQWHIGTACFEDPQHPDDHLERPLDTQPHQRVGSNPRAPAMRHLIGTRIEFITHHLSSKENSDSLGSL